MLKKCMSKIVVVKKGMLWSMSSCSRTDMGCLFSKIVMIKSVHNSIGIKLNFKLCFFTLKNHLLLKSIECLLYKIIKIE